MSENNTISGYTAEEWCNDKNLKLVIERQEATGETEYITFHDHWQLNESSGQLEPHWPPLESNGDVWYIEQV